MIGVGLIALCMIWYSVYTLVVTFSQLFGTLFLLSTEGIEQGIISSMRGVVIPVADQRSCTCTCHDRTVQIIMHTRVLSSE